MLLYLVDLYLCDQSEQTITLSLVFPLCLILQLQENAHQELQGCCMYLTKKQKTEALLPDINFNHSASVEQVLPVGDDCNHPILIDVEAQPSTSKPVSTMSENCNGRIPWFCGQGLVLYLFFYAVHLSQTLLLKEELLRSSWSPKVYKQEVPHQQDSQQPSSLPWSCHRLYLLLHIHWLSCL